MNVPLFKEGNCTFSLTEEEGKAVSSGLGYQHCLSDWKVVRVTNKGEKCRPSLRETPRSSGNTEGRKVGAAGRNELEHRTGHRSVALH